MAADDELAKAREMMQKLTVDFKNLVEHPEIVDEWTPVERAWAIENMELLLEQLKDLKGNLEEMIE